MKLFNILFIAASLVCLSVSDMWAQTFSDGPMRLQIRVRYTYIDSYQDAGFGSQEVRWKYWARADQDILGWGWQGGQCIQQNNTSNYGWIWGPGSVVLLDQTYTGATVPSRFDLYIDAWEDDDCGNTCSYDDDCWVDDDDYRCGPGEFASDIYYRNYGPPCQWNDVGDYFACSGRYGAEINVYWSYAGDVNGTYTWRGTYSNNWFDACNWSTNTVPSSTKDVVIPAGTPNNPLVNSGSAYCNTITIADGAVITINSDNGAVLNVNKP